MHHARARVALHLFHGSFCRKAVMNRFFQTTHPAAIMREHAIGFQHLAMLALHRHIAARQHVIDGNTQGAERLVQPVEFGLTVLIEKIGHDDARLMQHHMAKPDTIVETVAAYAHRPPEIQFDSWTRQTKTIPGCDDFGENHGGCLKCFNLVFSIGAFGAILHDKNA